jgi:uncharacterized protein YfaQ (DUF2300 family)
MVYSVRLLLTSLCLVGASFLWASAATAKNSWLAWQVAPNEPVQVRTLEGSAPLLPEVPLGSTWKLFVFAYLNATGAQENPYRCEGTSYRRTKGDEYCCEAGETIERNVALVRSCSAYFEPARLRIDADQWRNYWQLQIRNPQLANPELASWLESITNLKPSTKLSVAQLLQGLAAVNPLSKQGARDALAPLVLKLGSGAVLQAWGTGSRFKTFSWDHPVVKGSSIGGAAGWLADGTPFWLGGQGASGDVLSRLAPIAKNAFPRVDTISSGGACVLVDFLTRYPIEQVNDAQTFAVASSGVLTRRYVLKLKNGTFVKFSANSEAGEILLTSFASGQAPQLTGRFTLNEYVARVIDREADAKHSQAAWALAVAARTYLVQNASFEQGCFRIADDSKTQRVSLNPASRSARAAAMATDELILDGATARYHRDQESRHVMSWQAAAKQSDEGKNFTAILLSTWPNANLAMLDGSSECKPIAAAQAWLKVVSVKWRRQLLGEPGFEMPNRIAVCELAFGNPYTDVRRARIYVRAWQSGNGRLTLAHEFMHLAFAGHPQGSDERYAEQWARRLVDPMGK